MWVIGVYRIDTFTSNQTVSISTESSCYYKLVKKIRLMSEWVTDILMWNLYTKAQDGYNCYGCFKGIVHSSSEASTPKFTTEFVGIKRRKKAELCAWILLLNCSNRSLLYLYCGRTGCDQIPLFLTPSPSPSPHPITQ